MTTPTQAQSPSHAHSHGGHNLTGMVIFLCSESVIFLAFFAGYAVFKLSAPQWLPDGVEGLEVRTPLINTIILVSSSFVAWAAETRLQRGQLRALQLPCQCRLAAPGGRQGRAPITSTSSGSSE